MIQRTTTLILIIFISQKLWANNFSHVLDRGNHCLLYSANKILGKNTILSNINSHPLLVKIAKEVGKDLHSQNKIDDLIKKMKTWEPGNRLGNGNRHLGNSFYEFRDGPARIVARYSSSEETGGVLIIVGKSSKNVSRSVEKMFNFLRKEYDMGNNPSSVK